MMMTKRVLVVGIEPTVPELLWDFLDFWIFMYVGDEYLTDPFKDAAATWLVPAAPLGHGHLN
jgi:hypothetical protein